MTTRMVKQHAWNLSPSEAISVQEKLAGEIQLRPLPVRAQFVAGVDCAYAPAREEIICSAVLCSWPELDMREVQTVRQSCTFPYVPGLLSFREAPCVIAALQQLSTPPELVLCDGQGIAHPRGLGLAAHVGLRLQIPTVGVAKKRLCGEYRMPGHKRGCATQLRVNGEVVGKVVRTRDKVKPLFVSPGHLADIARSVRWTIKTARRYRLPEPVRLAHISVTTARKSIR